MNLALVFQLASAIPSIIKAIQAIMASDAGHTIETAIETVIKHNTPGQPNAPALAPTAPDFQAPKG